MSRRSLLWSAAVLPVAAGCATGPDRVRLPLATGLAGGPYDTFGRRLADELQRNVSGLTVPVLNTSASVQNLRLIGSRGAELALSLGDCAADAYTGTGAFSVPVPLAALARLYLNYTLLVVAANGPYYQVADLAGRRVALGAEDSGTAVLGERILVAAGLAEPAVTRYLGTNDAIDALARREIDAFFFSGGVPIDVFTALSRYAPIRLLPLNGLAAGLRRSYGPTYTDVVIPAGTYGQRAEVPTIGVPSYLVTHRDLPEEPAFRVTRAIFAARDRLPGPETPGAYLDERFAIGTGIVPLHPGARRYYRSVYG
ncbi:TAXI family TRAP transporter solute-binding subunit [Nocardia miyunensis]|uniref:TAXI family TRAP transporter solute-binding subunit n=1 Tax=Nocardia miyunensis TaxID=282684 RepID=UPI000833B522|nr:TAXI family TRAP transporter solute-binding subunit [Nocardia miyunensis]